MNVLKVSSILFILSLFCTVSAVNSQNQRISLKLNNKNIKELFSEIEKKTSYAVLYERGLLDNKTITVDSQDQTSEEILDKVLPSIGLSYYIDGKQIIVVKNKAIPVAEEVEQDPTIVAGGTITDANGEPLPGVSVKEKGKVTNGTMTDADGKFSFRVNPGAVLEISYVGLEKQEVKAGASLKIIMKEQENTFEDVMVVGYGIQKKINVTGSIGTIDTKNMTERANTNLLTSAQGQVAGVTIISRPGATPTINFRGRGSTGGASSPLFVIDGAISDVTFFSRLDPNSIENISFLKDAASSAIYGSRAAYGVVLVTTKSGTQGKLQIDYNGFAGAKRATYRPKMLGADWYVALQAEGVYNTKMLNDPANAVKPNLDAIRQDYRSKYDPDMYPDTNWYDLVLDNDAFITQHSVSFRGGDTKTHYNTTLGYTLEDGYIPGERTNRYNVVSNISSDIKNWLTMRAGFKYILNKYRRKGSVSYMDLMVTPSTFVAKHSNGEYGTVTNGADANIKDLNQNPLRVLEQDGWQNVNNGRMNILAAADVKLFKDLILTGEINYNSNDSKSKTFKNSWDKLKRFTTGAEISGTERPNQLDYNWNESTRVIYNGLANYSLKLADKHNIGALLGVSYEVSKYQQLTSNRKNLLSNDLSDIEAGSTMQGDFGNGGGSYVDKLMSTFGRLTYNFDEKYLFEFNVRADGHSRFHKDHRWGYYPSISVGWRVSEENFMKDIAWVHNLKLRASWGELGNINVIGPYAYFSTYKVSSDYDYNFEDGLATGIAQSAPANPNLKWETVTITDFGLDFDVLNGKAGLVFDYYNKRTDDILMEYYLPNEIGVRDQVSGNVGVVKNSGFELALRYRDKIGNFSFEVNGNIAKNWNKILDMGPNNNSISNPWISAEGYPIGAYIMYKTDGLLTQDDIDSGNYVTDGTVPQAGDIKYVDVHKDGKLDEKDRIITKCDVPDLTYGIGVNVAYKGFDLAIFGQGIGGVHTYFQNEMAHPFFNYSSPREYHLTRWTVDNPDPKAAYPRIYTSGAGNAKYNQLQSDFWLFKGDYFRIKNITLGYTVSGKLINKYSLSALKFYVSLENPFTIRADKRMKDFDPESASGRAQNSIGSQMYTFGINLSF
ncbi:SusC/RagA family TonB-linked outer membrane protein [Dysgonomonas sp. GY75]|nr:SusC/RagA family TonB-linked outer membrane protein [Dysgonomonas sp. GY75]